MNIFKTFIREVFGSTITLGDKRFKTKDVRNAGSLYYLIKEPTEENPFSPFQIEVLLPSSAADHAVDYLRRVVTPYGVTMAFSDDSDELASKVEIRVPQTGKHYLALQLIETILLSDLRYQRKELMSYQVFNYSSELSDLLSRYRYSLDDIKWFSNKPGEEVKRVGEENIEFQCIHYAYRGKMVNVLQTTTMVTKSYLIHYLETMEKTTLPLSGQGKVMDVSENKLTLYIFE